MYYQLHQFVDEDGRQVFQKCQMETDENGKISFTWIGTFTVSVPTPYGPQDAQIQFDFPTEYNLKECFEKFDKLAKEEYDRLIKEVKEKTAENKILTPDEMGGIVMPK